MIIRRVCWVQVDAANKNMQFCYLYHVSCSTDVMLERNFNPEFCNSHFTPYLWTEENPVLEDQIPSWLAVVVLARVPGHQVKTIRN